MQNTRYAFEVPQKLLDFFYPSFPTGKCILLKTLIKKSKRKHNSLCYRYFNVIQSNKSTTYTHLQFISNEYEQLLYYINELIILAKNTDSLPVLREVSNVVEETALEIWYKLCEVQKEYDRLHYKKQGESFLPRDGGNYLDDEEDDWDDY